MTHLQGSFVGIGIKPRVESAEALTQTTVKVTFVEPMRDDAELRDPANYTITADGGSAARVVEGVSTEPINDSMYVILELDGVLTVGTDNYNVQVDTTIADAAGNTLDPAYDDADFSGLHAAVEVDHCESAKARLAWQLREREAVEAYVCALAVPAEDLEQAMIDVKSFRSLETSSGAQMDRVGAKLGGQLRGALTDADFRVRLRARAQVNASHGRPNEMLDALELLDNGFNPDALELAEHPPATIVMQCHVPSGATDRVAEFSIGFLKKMKPAGVKMILEGEEEDVILFQMQDEGEPAPPAGSGMADESDPTNGGHMRIAV